MSARLPAYLQIAADLRAQITSGQLPAGAKLPTEQVLMTAYGVSNTVTKRAIALLKAEGLVEGVQGSGVYVRGVRRIVRESRTRNSRSTATSSPFASDAQASGQRGTWEHRSEETTADAGTAARLHIEPGDPVICTRYRYLVEGQPVQLSTSWEPLAVTGGTAVMWPEDGAAVGVVARMDHIGVRIDDTEERITWRPAQPDEALSLNLSPRGAFVLVIQRTYTAGGMPVETADIIVDAARYELVYRIPVD